MPQIEGEWANLLRDLSSSDARVLATDESADNLMRLRDHPLLLRQHLLRETGDPPHQPLRMDIAVLASSDHVRIEGARQQKSLSDSAFAERADREAGSPFAFEPSEADRELSLNESGRSPDGATACGVRHRLAGIIRHAVKFARLVAG